MMERPMYIYSTIAEQKYNSINLLYQKLKLDSYNEPQSNPV